MLPKLNLKPHNKPIYLPTSEQVILDLEINQIRNKFIDEYYRLQANLGDDKLR